MAARTRPLAGFLLTAVLAVANGAARAQDLSAYFPPGVPGYDGFGRTVLSRPRPRYDPLGVRVGDFLLFPRIDLGLGYDSNLLGSSPGRGSWLIGSHVGLLINSDWSRDSLGVFVGFDDRRTPDMPSQGQTNGTGSIGGTLDIGRDKLTLAAAHLWLHQDRTAIDALPTDQPVAYQVSDFRALYMHAFNRLSLTPNLELESYRFASTTIMGVPTPQADRDRNVLQGGLDASYELAPLRHVVVVLRGLGSLYTAPQPGAPSRNSSGLIALTGIDYGGPNWGVRLLLGWEQRNFAAPQFQSHGAPVAQLDASWSPTGLTTLTATMARTIEDAAQEGVAGFTYTTARISIDHEYLRNVLLRGFASVQNAEFLQGGGSQTSFTVGGSVTWLINRRMRLVASEAFTDLHSVQGQSPQIGGSYVRSISLLTLGLGL